MGDANGAQLQIPVVNISPSNPNAPEELLSAASTYGFVFIENSEDVGIPQQEIDRMFELSKEFFAAPSEVKDAVSIASNKAGKNHGYLSQGIEKLDPKTQKRPDCKEAFNLAPPLPDESFEQPLPIPLKSHASTLTFFQHRCHTLCQLLFTHLATSLSLPTTWFTSKHDQAQGPSGTVFRLLHYPPQPAEFENGVDLRAGAHSDFGSLTLLFRLPEQSGLEVQTPSGEWAAVPADPTDGQTSALPILVNIGDLLEDWTGGLLKSTVHRVVFPQRAANGEEGEDRYSIAYFCHPLDNATLDPVPSDRVMEFAARKGGERRRVVTAKEHLMERLGATYQIDKKV